MSCSNDGDCCGGYGCSCGDYCDSAGSCGEQNGDPILIDLTGAGFPLTNSNDGVKFDFQANGKPNQYAWTAKGANVGFLVLDRNGNGKIDNGAELFSNISPQPTSKEKRYGFPALAVFDLPANGGNHDGWITAKDAVYSKLRIWVDLNHDGISQASELLTLAQLGVKAISVNATLSKWTDVYGNQFRYKGEIVWQKPVNGQTTAAIYDAILMVKR